MEKNKIKVTNTEESINLANAGRSSIRFLTTGLCVVIIIGSVWGTVKVVKNNKNNNVNTVNEVDNVELNDPAVVTETEVQEENNVAEENIVVEENDVTEEETLTTTSTFEVGGSWVDNHNQELYIFNMNDVLFNEEINNSLNNTNPQRPSSNTSGSYTTTTNDQTNNQTNNTPSNPTPSNPTPSEPSPSNPAPSNPTPSEPSPSNPAPSNPTPSEPTPSNPTPSEPSLPTPPEPIDAPDNTDDEELVYEGYVMQKLNYEKDGYWFTFYYEDGEIKALATPIEMIDESERVQNSNIYGIGYDKNCSGWKYIKDNNKDDCDLGLVSDYESEIQRLVSQILELLKGEDKGVSLKK